MTISQLKEEIQSIVEARGVKTIQKDYSQVLSDIEKALDFYKKNKDTDKKDAFVKVLKKLGEKKKQLAKELDDKVSGMYRNAEYQGESVNEISIPQLAKKDAEHLNHYVGGKSEKEVRAFIDRVYKFYPKDVRKYMADAFMDYQKGNKTLKYLTTVLRVMHQDIRESVNEASSEPQIISQLRDIVKNKQNQSLKDPKSGKKMRVDLYSANLITQVYDAIKSQSTKEKFLSGGLLGMQSMAFKVTKR